MRPASTATSAARGGAPVPSTSSPPRITRSCMSFLPGPARSRVEPDFDRLSRRAHREGDGRPPDRLRAGPPVAHIELAAVHGALEHVPRELPQRELDLCVRAAVLE